MPLFEDPQRSTRRQGALQPAVPVREFALIHYAQAYWHAARLLVESGEFDKKARPDFQTYPIAYLYRHATEPAIKAILVENFNAAKIAPSDVLKKGHRLTELLPFLRNVLCFFGISVGKDFAQLAEVLKEWDQYDRTAEAFRYSVKKDALTPTRLDEDFTFALKRFAGRMDGALEFLFETHREAEDRLFQEIERASL